MTKTPKDVTWTELAKARQDIISPARQLVIEDLRNALQIAQNRQHYWVDSEHPFADIARLIRKALGGLGESIP